MVRQFKFNLYFHLLKRIQVYSGEDVSSDFLFCVLRPASIRDDEATTSKELIVTEVPMTLRKTRVAVANLAKQ